MTKTQINKYNKARIACAKYLKATYGVHSFIQEILVGLRHGKIKKVQNRLSKVQELLSPEDYNSFKAEMLDYKGSIVFCEHEWDKLVNK